MFYDVTLLTGADIKTFQERVEKSLHQEKKSWPIKGVFVCVCVRGGGVDRKTETLQFIYYTWM